MKKFNFLFILTISLISFISCGKETQTTTQGGGKLVIKLTSVPASNYEAIAVQNITSYGGIERYYFPNKNNSGEVLTDTFNVTTGQNFPIFIYGASLTGCAKIYIETYLNGKLYKTRSFSVGGNPTYTFGGPSTTCDYANAMAGTNRGIPYNITID